MGKKFMFSSYPHYCRQHRRGMSCQCQRLPRSTPYRRLGKNVIRKVVDHLWVITGRINYISEVYLPSVINTSKAFFVSVKDISNACRVSVVDTGDNLKHRQHHSSVWLTRGEGFLTGTKSLYGEKCYMMTVHYSIQETSGN
jgi:hypothetical protein